MSVRAFTCLDTDDTRHILLPDRPRRRDFLKVLFGRFSPTMTVIQRYEPPEEPKLPELSEEERAQRSRIMQGYPLLGLDAAKNPEDIHIDYLRAAANVDDPFEAHAEDTAYRPPVVKISAGQAITELARRVEELDKTVKETING